ncbi:class I SAM-dependent rRNA methyltransferase [Neomoorella humiferrea]|uniref:Ribosomal RNA large subunit methyltransferase I n=1 Tax=Neomoorella humiferrea TaxID=676965 RepID=A0A2T0AMG7_9FIRM|nr:class I SAM-dependent rRNA methyltransferase [Moorella humiferrea]PRR69935.1 Ribosomal RNA large subunit methyltransferase I [Moorella humiferrea]
MARVQLRRGEEGRLQRGHPWVYRTEIASIHGTYTPGDIVAVEDYRGRFIGRGYINPASMITVRILTNDRDEKIDKVFWRRRLTAAVDYRRRVLAGAGTDAYRVVFGEADFLPGLIVDKFGPYLVVQTLALGIDRFKETLVEILDELLQPEGIYERNDAPVRELEGLELRSGFLKGPFDPQVIIQENGLKFYVDLAAGQKTGYFLDQRENRAALQSLVKGARVLDCFCHTGGFSVHAAHYGAREVLGLDISPEAIAMARRNAVLNGFGNLCSFEEANVFDALREFERRKERFDVVILDPPAFVKARKALEGAIRGYKEINLRAMKLLSPGGFLVTCSCSYHMPEDLFLEVIQSAAMDARRRLRLLARRGQALDHPVLLGYDESRYLKCLLLEII